MTSRPLFAVVLSLFTFAFAQQPAPAPLEPPIVADNNIMLDVVVNDKSGHPVSGLTQQQFTIIDNKQPQNILSFTAVNSAPGAAESPHILLLVDAVNTSYLRVAYVHDQIKKFLERDNGSLAHPMSVGVFSDSGLEIQGTSSTNGNDLMAYLDAHNTGLRTNRRSEGFYGAEERAQMSLGALSKLAEAWTKIPGRKMIVWISPGWALLTGPRIELTNKQEQGLFNSIVAMSTLLRQAHIALYSIDPVGTNDAGSFRTFYYQSFLKGVAQPKQAVFADLALQVLATQSGGRVLNSSNDITGEIATAVHDANSYYVLTYQPPAADGPDDYHSIEVKLAQHDLKAQTHMGYYAQPVAKHPAAH